MQYIADSAAACSMTPNAVGLTNYRKCSRPLGLASGGTTSIARYGDLAVAFRSDNGWVHVQLHDVAHTPLLSYILISLSYLALKGHTCAGVKDTVTVKLKEGKTVYLPLTGKLSRQYRYRPEAKGRVVDTACAGKQKLPSPPLTSTFSTALTATHTRCCSRERRSSKESTPAGYSTSAGDVQMGRGYGSPWPDRCTPEKEPSTPPTPPQQLPPVVEEGESTAGEGASGKGASNQGGGRMKNLDSESDLAGMMKVWPPVPPAKHEAPEAEPGAGAAGVRKATPRYHRSPPVGTISVISMAAVAATRVTTAAPAVRAATATTAGTFPRLWGDLRGT